MSIILEWHNQRGMREIDNDIINYLPELETVHDGLLKYDMVYGQNDITAQKLNDLPTCPLETTATIFI